jgi:hypothetical protein
MIIYLNMNYANVIKIIIAPENNKNYKILDINIYILFIFIRYL